MIRKQFQTSPPPSQNLAYEPWMGRRRRRLDCTISIETALLVAIAVLLAAGVSITLAVKALSSTPPAAGTVVGHRVTPAHHGVVPLRINGNWHYLDNQSTAAYELQLRQCPTAAPEPADCSVEWVTVSEADYYAHPVGSTIGQTPN